MGSDHHRAELIPGPASAGRLRRPRRPRRWRACSPRSGRRPVRRRHAQDKLAVWQPASPAAGVELATVCSEPSRIGMIVVCYFGI